MPWILNRPENLEKLHLTPILGHLSWICLQKTCINTRVYVVKMSKACCNLHQWLLPKTLLPQRASLTSRFVAPHHHVRKAETHFVKSLENLNCLGAHLTGCFLFFYLILMRTVPLFQRILKEIRIPSFFFPSKFFFNILREKTLFWSVCIKNHNLSKHFKKINWNYKLKSSSQSWAYLNSEIGFIYI